MGALRTQIYLTAKQRKRLDEIARDEGKSLAEVIRKAVDNLIEGYREEVDIDAHLAKYYGAVPDFPAPPSRRTWRRSDQFAG